jgi:threonine dehydrogenase-like Zn-dependent dehydrogenase
MSSLPETENAPSMRALVREVDDVRLRQVPRPVVARSDDVVVRVAVAGVCRTDVRVARGELGTPPLILGHEFSGVVEDLGPGAGDLRLGERVTVVPLIPCGRCPGCLSRAACHAPQWLGLDLDGSFADFVRVPASCVLRLPPGLDLRRGAYVEPVAAALAVLRAGIDRDHVVVVGGRNRIATLAVRVLAAHGVTTIVRYDPDWDPPPPEGSADVAIESTGTHGLDALAGSLRPGGTLVLKSRDVRARDFDLGRFVARDLAIRGFSHGSFPEAIRWLVEDRLPLDDLLAPPRPLEAYREVLDEAENGEAEKRFFAIGSGDLS